MTHVGKILEHDIVRMFIYLKGLLGVIQAIAGTVLLAIGPNRISKAIEDYLEGNVNSPNSLIVRILTNITHSPSHNIHLFIALFMIVHGLVFIAAVMALIHKKLWAFPVAGVLLMIFIAYQVYSLSVAFSVGMMILTILDAIILVLLRMEYKRLRMTSKEII